MRLNDLLAFLAGLLWLAVVVPQQLARELARCARRLARRLRGS